MTSRLQSFTSKSQLLELLEPARSQPTHHYERGFARSSYNPSAMRPSMSVLEPGLERGVPWGRDLYTFVTSAAGHMMRTLQKPRKSRPSKRQVNHRRFLHNMIQRKFADIEAANHRLASAIYSKEGEKSTPSLLSHKQETPGNPPQGDSLQDAEKYSVPTDTDGILSSSGAADTHEADAREKQQPDSRHHWKSPHKFTFATRTSHQSKGTHTLDEFPAANSSKDKHFFHSECQLKPTSNLTEDSQASPNNSSSILATQNENDSPFSSDFSPLFFDSCDFSIHMISSCSEAEKKNITEGHDLYSPGNFYSEGCMDVQDYFESICSCQDDTRLDVCANNILVSDPPDHFTAGEDVFSEVGEYNYEYGCLENQEVMPNFFRDNQRSSHMQSELTQHQSSVMNQSPVSPSISCSHNVTQLQTHQRFKEGGPHTLVNNINLTPFEGVAQSFTAPPPHHNHRSVPTPPQEEDWLFTDILKDRQSSYY